MRKVFWFLLSVIALSYGKIIYVGPGGSDDSTGLTIERRLHTINRVFSSDNANRADTCDTIAVWTSTGSPQCTVTTTVKISFPNTPVDTTRVFVFGYDSATGFDVTKKSIVKGVPATSELDSGIFYFGEASAVFVNFARLVLDSGKYSIFANTTSDYMNGCSFKDMIFRNTTSHSLSVRVNTTVGNELIFDRCEWYSINGYAIFTNSNTRTPIIARFCTAYDCAGGFSLGIISHSIANSIFANIDSVGVLIGAGTTLTNSLSINNCFFIDCKDGLRYPPAVSPKTISNNCFAYNTRYGINTSGSELSHCMGVTHNNFYGNAAEIDINSGIAPNIRYAVNPQFTDTTNHNYYAPGLDSLGRLPAGY